MVPAFAEQTLHKISTEDLKVNPATVSLTNGLLAFQMFHMASIRYQIPFLLLDTRLIMYPKRHTHARGRAGLIE